MTDAQSSSSSASHDSAERTMTNGNSGFRWFASEFLVVVAGILVALGLQAWWQDRQDSARGAVYQQQILSDVRITERTLRESFVLDRAHYSATKLLSAALYQSDTPTKTQALQWLQSTNGWFADPRPILGNVNALIQTGEIRLVKNAKARAAIIAYGSIMGSARDDRDTQSARMLRANDLELARLESAGLPAFIATPSKNGVFESDQLKEYLPVYIAAWSQLRADEQFRTAQQWRLMAYSNIEAYNQEMLSATTKLRVLLEEDGR